MFPFVFKLAKGIQLKEAGGKYFLISPTPIRYLELNQSLYQLLTKICDGFPVDDMLAEKTGAEGEKIVETVLNLAAKGFLALERHGDRDTDLSDAPFVSVIIPVRNRPKDIGDCLQSIRHLCYPQEKIEVIVVDDASTDDTAAVVRSFGVKLICNDRCKGPGACRNMGARNASGEILVFLDSDCTASPDWFTDIVPFFRLPGIDAIGGFVAGYFRTAALDRYEDAFSSLNMGKRMLFAGTDPSMFYVPTCNLFVRREVFQEMKGFRPEMQVGEDVDFCWRLRRAGYRLLYLPLGTVFHKHRNTLGKMLKRRFDYGTSEADLYRRHEEKKKMFSWPLYQGVSFLVVFFSIVTGAILPLWVLPVLLILDFRKKKQGIKAFIPLFTNTDILLAAFRSFFSFWYYCCFYCIRYYLILMVLWMLVFPLLGLFFLLAVLVSSTVDYCLKKPRLFFPTFLFLYILEHAFYQCGVFYGCVHQRYFRCLWPTIRIS